MSWLGHLGRFQWTEGIKNTACRYLLQRYLGKFLEEKLTLDQLTVNLCNGTGSVTNVKLDVQALNEMGEQYQLPVQFIDGLVEEMSISIPWLSLLTEPSYVEIKGLRLTVQPRKREDTGTSMFESMLSSMNSSMQLAQECLQEETKDAGNSQPLESVELFAQTIDSILCKIKVRFLDTVIRLEHVPLGSTTGVALELRIENVEYFDEAGSDPNNPNLDPNQQSKGYVVPTFMTKKFYMEGVIIYTDEFPSKARTSSRSRCSTPDSRNSDAQYSSPQISPNQSVDNGEESYLNNSPTNAKKPIIFAKISGRQEIGLKIKQGEVSGPKVELEVILGSFASFLSPRQVHVLLELAHGLASPDLEDVSNVISRNCTEKTMTTSDFNRVNRDLYQKIQPIQGLRSLDLRHTQGWSTSTTIESEYEDVFVPIGTLSATSMSDSLGSNNISMDGSITASSITSKSSVKNLSRHKYRQSIDIDPTAETSQFHIRISSIAIILLHEDILYTECGGLTNASTKQMEATAENFFKKLDVLSSGSYGNKDFVKTSKLFVDACQLSHIKVLAEPLIVEASEKTTAQFSAISGNVSLVSLEVVECLVDLDSNSQTSPTTEFVELLTFIKEEETSEYWNTPNFRMTFHYTEKAVRHGQITKFAQPRTKMTIQMQSCRSEIDVTIVDRISAVLNPQTICTCSSSPSGRDPMNHQSLFYQAVESPTLPESTTDIEILSPKCIVKLRFPIPDMRPVTDLERIRWWKRSVRPDYVTFQLIDTKIHSSMQSQSHHLAKHEIQCRRLLLTYTEADSDVPVEIGKASADEKSDVSLQPDNKGFGWPRIVITIYPRHLGGPLEDSSEGEPESSLDDTLENLENTARPEPSPFSSKRIIHESDTPHSKFQTQGEKQDAENGESDELIIPGNRAEMLKFIEAGTCGSRIQLEIGLPCTSIQIPSKHLYELLYNRFNTDLFLWEPSDPKTKYKTVDCHTVHDFSSNVLQDYPRFSMCKSGIQYDSDTDSCEEDVIYHSTQERTSKARISRVSRRGQSKLALSLNINHGLLSMYTPVRDSLKKVIPGQQGELILRLEDATIFSVSAYKGDVNLGYVCAMAKDVSLNHCGLTTRPSQTPPLRSINSIIPRHCKSTIYRTEPGANIFKTTEEDMLTVAIRIQAAHQTHKIKTFRIAVGIRNATLRHRMCTSQTSWFTQLTDCLNVNDHPIAGYSPPGVLTEFHIHLWDTAIDYRPIHLPLRALVTLGSFSISSNIAAQTNTSTLRFIAEDLALFISDKIGKNKNVDLRRNYVCVVDLGLFELSLRSNEKMCEKSPKVDLRASNNCLNVRTCADSGRALMELLTYFASDGDIAPNIDNSDNISVPGSGDEEILVGDESINNLSKSQVERVNILMEEAMEDTVKGTTVNVCKKSSEGEKQVEEFFFPDESNPFLQYEYSPEASKPSMVHEINVKDEEDLDEDFCILGEEAGVGILPIHGVPEIRWLCQESFHIIEKHFPVPSGKTDLLKAPKNFPLPVSRYTLREMNLKWQWYGGNDFESSQTIGRKHVTIDEASQRFNAMSQGRSRSVIGGVGFSKSSPNEIRFGSVPNSPRVRTKESPFDWHRHGGPGRNAELLMELRLHKIRFQHEVYPEDTTQASRQILLVNEIEIKDRLASSDINKFLYQYSSEGTPRQSHANMFEMKLVHIRPDPKISAQEVCLKISVLPLQLNIDQDSLHFLIEFFTKLTDVSKQSQENFNSINNVQSSPGSKQGTPTHHPPVMSVNDSDSSSRTMDSSQGSDMVDQNLLILLEDELRIKENKHNTKTVSEAQDDSQPLYFRSVVFSPAVCVKVDYQGKHVDFSHGPLVGILMGLTHLNKSELCLKELSYRHGLLGLDKLITYLLQEWIQDIKDNQLKGLLVGVGPMHSLVQLVQGIRDLFWMPIEQYQKDGRIVRGLQRGANSFTTSTAMAALELTSRLVHAIQSTAETAYDMVSPGPSVRQKSRGQKGRKKRYNQPSDIREGMTNAYMLVKEGLGETANQLVRVASEEHEHKGVSGAVGGVLRQIPPTVVKPIILATEATSNVLGGIQSQLVPDARREAVQKWRQDYPDIN